MVAAGCLMAIAFAALPPVTQDPGYHAFADGRTLHGVANFWNVISNVPFFLAALYGVWALRSSNAFIEPWERMAYCALLAGTAAAGAGSVYYHLHPDNGRLFWDRLPMTVVFMSVSAATIGERLDMQTGKAWLLPMILTGLASAIYWRVSGDLRPYGAVQFGTMVAVPIMLARFPSRYSGAGRIWGTVALYALAKMAEILDRAIGSILATGGHPWKHVAAAGAVLFYVDMVARRRPLEAPPARNCAQLCHGAIQ